MTKTIEISDDTAAILAAQSDETGLTESQLIALWARQAVTPAAANEAFERWVLEEIVPGHAEYVADPSKAVPAEELLSRIKERRSADHEA